MIVGPGLPWSLAGQIVVAALLGGVIGAEQGGAGMAASRRTVWYDAGSPYSPSIMAFLFRVVPNCCRIASAQIVTSIGFRRRRGCCAWRQPVRGNDC